MESIQKFGPIWTIFCEDVSYILKQNPQFQQIQVKTLTKSPKNHRSVGTVICCGLNTHLCTIVSTCFMFLNLLPFVRNIEWFSQTDRHTPLNRQWIVYWSYADVYTLWGPFFEMLQMVWQTVTFIPYMYPPYHIWRHF